MTEPRGASSYRMVPIDLVDTNQEQPRTSFDAEALSALTDSISEHGVLSPLVVRKNGGRYVLIAGERRLRASALAGLQEVPVIVRSAQQPAQQLELALVENLLRDDLDAVEEAWGFQRLMDVYGYTQERVATAMGKNRATIANTVRLLKLAPRVLEAIQQAEISAGHGRALLSLPSLEEQVRVLAHVIGQGLTVRATERLVASRLAQQTERDHGLSSSSAIARRVEETLQRTLGTEVSVRPRRTGGGRVVIDYADDAHLDRLVEALRERKGRP